MNLLLNINSLFSNDYSVINFIYKSCKHMGDVFTFSPIYGLILYSLIIIGIYNKFKQL